MAKISITFDLATESREQIIQQVTSALGIDDGPEIISVGIDMPQNFTHEQAHNLGAAVGQQLAAMMTDEVPGEPKLDAEGVPWDERIHSGNKTITAKGVWQRRKNIADPTYHAIKAELKKLVGSQAPAVPPSPPVTATSAANAPVAAVPASVPTTPPQVVTQTPVPPTAPSLFATPLVPPAPAAQTAAPQASQFAQFSTWLLQRLRTADKPERPLLKEWLDQILTHYGIVNEAGTPAFTLLQHKEEYIPDIKKWLADAIGEAV